MAKQLPTILMQLLSVGLLFYSLLSASAVAREAAKSSNIPPTVLHQSAEPGTPPQSGGDAQSVLNAVATTAKTAIDMDNETVKHVETFYMSTIQLVAAVAAIIALVGAASVGRIARSTAKEQATQVLEEYEAKYSAVQAGMNTTMSKYNEIISEHASINTEYNKLRKDINIFQKEARENLHGLRSAFLAWAQLMNYMLKIEEAEGQQKLRLEGQRKEAKRLLIQLFNEIKPTDEQVLSLANSVYGTILYFEGKYKDALDALREAVKQNPTNYSAEFNRACCACKHADKLQLTGASEAHALLALEREALDSLICVLREESWRMDEGRGEAGENRDLYRLATNSHFILLTYEAEISSSSNGLREPPEPRI